MKPHNTNNNTEGKKMKQITTKLLFELEKSHNGLNNKSCKWNSIFDTEEELINALFNDKVYTDENNVPMRKWCRGYEYIKGFRKYYKKNGKLTDAQMKQLKRLASEIAYCIYCAK